MTDIKLTRTGGYDPARCRDHQANRDETLEDHACLDESLASVDLDAAASGAHTVLVGSLADDAAASLNATPEWIAAAVATSRTMDTGIVTTLAGALRHERLRIADLEKERDRLKQLWELAGHDREQAEEDADALSRRLTRHESEIASIATKLENVTRNFDSAQSEVERLRPALSSSVADYDAAVARIDEVTAERDGLLAQLELSDRVKLREIERAHAIGEALEEVRIEADKLGLENRRMRTTLSKSDDRLVEQGRKIAKLRADLVTARANQAVAKRKPARRGKVKR